MTEKPGVWRDATEADQGKIVMVKCKNNGGYDWDCYEKARIVKLKNKWAVMDASDGRNDFSLYGVVQVFDETPAATPEPEWVPATVEMVGREVVAQFRHTDDQPWAGPVKGVLVSHNGLWSTSATNISWYAQCRVKPLDTKAEEPKAEAGKAATDDGWRDAVWPDDWGMTARSSETGMTGYLVGYDPIDEYPWLIRYRGDDQPDQFKTCQVNDRLPRFVMPGGGK
jgi:hypothetical protein